MTMADVVSSSSVAVLAAGRRPTISLISFDFKRLAFLDNDITTLTHDETQQVGGNRGFGHRIDKLHPSVHPSYLGKVSAQRVSDDRQINDGSFVTFRGSTPLLTERVVD